MAENRLRNLERVCQGGSPECRSCGVTNSAGKQIAQSAENKRGVSPHLGFGLVVKNELNQYELNQYELNQYTL
jgi:hypothetical protein